ncbi:D-alanyl-D-alanine carboxypeptidase family protein [Phycicoccus sp. M110.8]|uniref:D-alanyl-D-alanine carboxypeptidase family protein n=1 Tax=Phycicoccus sp. M110.8 TaxID=3075433 RepID=UPI0028FD4594|nr:D-alanyl-D-alanine carboxypeptidase family protein [Phycicoccus sp. M110.8]MDU0313554.1 D-alanyl-D-alanine carboxypeptidase family protein [Phycicoccus sp. M110.8]
MTTTHQSAGRRRRRVVRRAAAAAVALLVAGGAAGYAAWSRDAATTGRAPAPAVAAGARGGLAARTPGGTTPPAGAAPTTPRPRTTSTAGTPTRGAGTQAHRPAGTTAFAPVVTDRIPAPAVSIALTAPVPGTTNMQPSAAHAFERAFAAARAQGLSPQIRSAWRSRAYQQVLFDRAVATYGSAAEAGKWVLSPGRSAHVKGYAVDVHPQAVAVWLEVHGPAYGICRTYDNEWWHFEYLATSTCPPRLPTAAG